MRVCIKLVICGRIKSLERYKQNHSKLQLVNEKILPLHINKRNGYMYVYLNKNAKGKYCRVHRLIAEAFIDNPNNLPQVNHIDGNKQNNRVDNLEWCTSKENIKHSYKLGLSNNYKIKVNQYDLKGELVGKFKSISEASIKTGVSMGDISQCINGKRKTANKFVWKKQLGWEV